MQILRNSLLCVLLAVGVVIGIKVCYLIDQSSVVLGDVQSVVAQAGPQMVGATMEARQAATELAGASREQRSYYKATGKALVIATVSAARLIQRTDLAIQQLGEDEHLLAQNTNVVLGDIDTTVVNVDTSQQALATTANKQLKDTGSALRLTLGDTSAALEKLRDIESEVEPGVVATVGAAQNIQLGTHHIEVALAPMEKPVGKLKFILHWLMGLPHISIIP
jgi:hypothetical protein